MAAQFSVVLAVSKPLFRESGSDYQSHPNPLGLSPTATVAYFRNGLPQTHCTYVAYSQQFSCEKRPVFGTKIVTPTFSSPFKGIAGGCHGYAAGRWRAKGFGAKPECPSESGANGLRLSEGLLEESRVGSLQSTLGRRPHPGQRRDANLGRYGTKLESGWQTIGVHARPYIRRNQADVDADRWQR